MVILCRYILLFYATLFCNFQEVTCIPELEQNCCCVEDYLYDDLGCSFVYEYNGLLSSHGRQVKVSRDQSQKRLKQNSKNSLTLSTVFNPDLVDFTLKSYAGFSPFFAGLITYKHSHLTILRRYII